jgi:acyl-coenzyme A thioesterase PaaI-like protein
MKNSTAIAAPPVENESNHAAHRFCIMCGRENPLSFGLKFNPDDTGAVMAVFRGNETLQGYEGIMHGGILSALIDTAMAQCLLLQNIAAMTGELKIRYHEPVNCSSLLKIRAWVTSSLPPLYHLKAEISVDGKTVCRGSSKFMERNVLQTAGVGG